MNIDTNILIAYITGEEAVVRFVTSLREIGTYFYVSTVTEAELLAFSGWTDADRIFVKNFLKQNFVTIPFAQDLVDLVAKLRREAKLKLPDAIIAATALHAGTPLLTRNMKDFKKVKALKVVTI